jgi:hypothetical protein
MQNVVGLELVAVPSDGAADTTAAGREVAPCRGCHFDGWFALDRVAAVLPRKGERFDAYRGGPREILGGIPVANDEELVRALVASEDFAVHACRLSFAYLYGRRDGACDGPLLDPCVDAFRKDGAITSALRTIAADPSFCE